MLGGEFLNKRENKKWMLNLLLSVTLLSLNQVFSSLSKNTYEVSVLEIFKISSTSAIITVSYTHLTLPTNREV